jgi:uncharacterized membrane protein YccF (DUF307 family)
MNSVHVLSYIAVAMAVLAVPLAVLDRVLASRARKPPARLVARATTIQPAERRATEAPPSARSQSMSRSSSSNVG